MSLKQMEEALLVKMVLDPDSYAADTHTGDIIDTRDYDDLLIILNAGENQTGATLDVTVL